MQIRNYDSVQDKEELIQLGKRLAGFELPKRIRRNDFEEKQRSWLEKDLIKNLESRQLLTLVVEEKAVGFIELLEEEDWITGEKQGYISRICVSEEMEGKGLGKELMNQAEQWAKAQGYRSITLNVFSSNRHAVRFYESLGYETETIKMRKEL